MFFHLSTSIPVAMSSLIFTFILFQAFGMLFLFRFIRKPWQGVKMKEEEVEQIEKEKLFESISSF